MAYGYDNNTLHLKLQTKVNDASKVYLVYGDYFWRYKDGNEIKRDFHTTEVTKRYQTKLYDYYFVAIKPITKRCHYTFVLESKGKLYSYGTKGVIEINEINSSVLDNHFNFPYLLASDIHTKPKWATQAIWYQIFPERFNRVGKQKGYLKWDSTIEVDNNMHFGGNIAGVIAKLPYLANLGITGIYFTPLFESPTTHKYDTINYFKIDPAFGTNEEFKELVDKAHALGLKIMLDSVFNHCSVKHPFFVDVVKNKEKSIYKDCFFIKRFPINTQPRKPDEFDLDYETFSFSKHMPKWNTDNEIASKHLLDSLVYWIKEYDIDAWRFDVSNEISANFLRKCKEACLKAKKDFYLVGENWDNANPWLAGDMFHSVMNYEIYHSILGYFTESKALASNFKDALDSIFFSYPEGPSELMFNLLGCHDTKRIWTICEGNEALVRLMYVVIFSLAGAPMIYYGDELGLEGKSSSDSRRCMIWDGGNKEFFSFIQKLIAFRKDNPATKTVYMKWLLVDDLANVLIYQKEDLYFIISKNPNNVAIKVPESLQNKAFISLLDDTQLYLEDNYLLPPYSCFILKENK